METYFQEIRTDKTGAIKNALISVLTTNVSSFFREKHHFDAFAEKILPSVLRKARSGKKVRIWSAGCSSGQEPYSIAMLLLSQIADIKKLDIKILGTDIDHKILDRARHAIYSKEETTSLPDEMKGKFLNAHPDKTDHYTLDNSVLDLVTLRPLNLLRPWPMKNRFDSIFCRNVLIYFNSATQDSLWPRFHAALEPDGHLFLGHSERIQNAELHGFSPRGVTTYASRPTPAGSTLS